MELHAAEGQQMSVQKLSRIELIERISKVFSPAAPINRRELFAGRLTQLERVFEATSSRGQHAVIFGERGVGKTSLATIVQDILTDDMQSRSDSFVVKINGSQDDDFSSIWKKAFGEIRVSADTGKSTMNFQSRPILQSMLAAELLPDLVKPNDVMKAARQLG